MTQTCNTQNFPIVYTRKVYYKPNYMPHTVMPSVKGQITIPQGIREKYNIGKETPIVLEDKGNGLITIKVMRMVDNDAIEYYENNEELGLHFKKPISPQLLIDAIKKIDG